MRGGLLGRQRRGAPGRVLWSFGDQAVSSGTNFLLTILVARSVGAAEFGAFALGLSVYLVCLTLARSSISETVVLSVGRAQGLSASEAAAGLRATLGLSVVAAALVASLAILLPRSDATAILLVLAAGLPGLLVQDYRRILFFALGQPRRAFVSDSVWAVLQLGGVAAAITAGVGSPTVLLAIWAASALLSGLLWPRVTRGWWREKGLAWLRDRRGTVLPLAGEGLLFQLGHQSAVFLLGSLAGLAQAGGYRGAQTLFGPVIVLMLGIRTAMLPELMRLSRHSPERALTLANRVTAGVAIFAAFWGLALMALPDSVGRQLLGPTWATAGVLVGFITIEKACSAIGWGAVLRLRILMKPRVSFLLRATTTSVGVVVACIGALLGGALGVAIGTAVVSPVIAVAWVLTVRIVRRGGTPNPGMKTTDVSTDLLEQTPGA